MEKITPKTEILVDLKTEHAYQTYQLLKNEVISWLDERGNFWWEKLVPSESPPYYPLVDLPEEAVLELWQRLNRVEGIVLSELDLRERWNEFKAVQTITDSEMLSRLHIALSGVAQLARETIQEPKKFEEKNNPWEEATCKSSVCQICGESATLTVLAPSNGKRYLHCLLCGNEWNVKRIGCICCGSEDASKQIYLHTKDIPGVDMAVCLACGQYFKEIYLRELPVEDFVWEDLRTLPLNYAAEQWLAEHAKITGDVQ